LRNPELPGLRPGVYLETGKAKNTLQTAAKPEGEKRAFKRQQELASVLERSGEKLSPT